MKPYKIAFVGLKQGLHTFHYTIDASFFAQFDYEFNPKDCLKVALIFEKANEHLFNLTFQITGNISVECDRCLAVIQLPVEQEYQVVVKMVAKIPATAIDNDDLDLIYITPETTYIDVEHLLYEFTLLSIPLHTALPEDDYGKPTCPRNADGTLPCNEKVLAILNESYEEHDQQTPENDTTIDPRWAALKKLK